MQISLLFPLLIVLPYAWLAYRHRSVALSVIAVSLPLYVVRFSVAGIPLTLLEWFILILAAAWICELITHRRSPLAGMSRMHRVWLAWFLVAAVIAVIVSPDLRAALGLLKAYCVEPVLLLLIAIDTCTTSAHWRRLGRGLLIGGSVVAAIAIVQYLTGWGIPDPWQAAADRRSTSIYPYPNAVGLYLAPLLVYAAARCLQTHQVLHRVLLQGVVVLLLAALVAARADGGVIAAAVGCGFLLLYSRWKWLAGVAGLVGVGLLILSPMVRAVVLLQDVSGQVRLALWQGTINLLQHHPWLGSGLGGFAQLYDQYRLPSHTELLLYPHNLWLDVWTQLGLLGLVWLLVTLVVGALQLHRVRRTAVDEAVRADALTLLAVWLAVLVYGLVDVVYFKNDLSALWWLWTGWSLVLINQNKKPTV